jgi:methionyl-tRNA synthetase
VVDTVGPDGSVIKVAADSGSKVSWLVEPNYVFKLSEFQQRLVDWIETSDVLRPANRVSEWLLEASAYTILCPSSYLH